MTLPVNEICFPPDTKERKQWFRGASFAHPAKMHLSLQLYLIEHYTKPGETILDPMAGSGTILVGCALERNVVCVELEKKFVDMQEANWDKIKALGPMLGYKMGTAIILQGDARQLEGLLVDKCIFSPPYAESQILGNSQANGIRGKNPGKFSKQNGKYSNNTHNIGNLPYGKISAVITSPPYEGSLSRDRSKDESFDEDREKKHAGGSIAIMKGYKADAVITSPPYENAVTGGPGGIDWSKATRGKAEGNKLRDPSKEPAFNHLPGKGLDFGYSQEKSNIGNLKSENYLLAMLQVYQQCHKVLKAGGLMCLVVKNFIRNKKIVQLDLDTIKLCEQVGFILRERLKRKLTQQSFWRIIYQQKYPNVPKIEFEDVLIFERAKG